MQRQFLTFKDSIAFLLICPVNFVRHLKGGCVYGRSGMVILARSWTHDLLDKTKSEVGYLRWQAIGQMLNEIYESVTI